MLKLTSLGFVLLGCGAMLHASAQPARIQVGILIYEGIFDTEFIAPLDVMKHAAPYTAKPLEVFTVAPRPGIVHSAEGVRLQPDYSFGNAPRIDWLIVPSGKNSESDIHDKVMVDWVRSVGRRAQVVQSNCDGAFLLGEAGLLDGKHATTYPLSLDKFSRMFPKVTVRRGLRFVDDNDTVTSPGGVSSYDVALYVVEKHLGRDVAQKVAAELVLEWDLARVRHEIVPASPTK